jgi:hypothetical protein
MPRLQEYFPEDLYQEVKDDRLPIAEQRWVYGDRAHPSFAS